MTENEQDAESPEIVVSTMSRPKNKARHQENVERQPPYNVILVNDDDHTFDYVIEMLAKVCGHPVATGERMALEVHTKGRVIVYTTHKEKAELKCEQVLSYGPDHRSKNSAGSMSCYIEPAPTA